MIIGIMTSIIVALIGTIVVMSLRSRKQNGGHYIVPASFGGITLKVHFDRTTNLEAAYIILSSIH